MASAIENLFNKYEEVYTRLKYLHDKYDEASKNLADYKVEDEATRKARIKNFEKQIKDIGVYYAKVEYFREYAERNITSKNVPTLKALELDFNSLRHDASRIDTSNPNDPYAYRLYVHAQCNKIYLMRKQKEFEDKKAELENGKNVEYDALVQKVDSIKAQLESACESYIRSEEFAKFAKDVKYIHTKYDSDLYDETKLMNYHQYLNKDMLVSFGMRAQPLPVIGKKATAMVKNLLSFSDNKLSYYDEKSSNILLPVDYDLTKEVCIYVKCSTVKANRCFRGINSFILNRIRRTTPGERNLTINFVDALHYNNMELKALKPIEGTDLLAKVPQSTEDIEGTLGRIVAGFPDIDDVLQDYESVYEYNIDNPDSKLDFRIMVLNGYPNAYTGEARKSIERIIYNHKRYGISLVLVENTGYDQSKEEDKDQRSLGSTDGVYYIDMPVGTTSTIQCENNAKVGFRWYEYDYKKHPLPQAYVDEIKQETKQKTKTSTEYAKNFPLDKWKYPDKSDENAKKISLPYGVDGKGEIRYVSFGEENFATYLMGASGSGKSTLLHTLITGIIRNYHPDDVELWLADFKMAEFSQYIDPMPPHVKYILLDESDELIYDFVDKLDDVLHERQKFFMESGSKKIEKISTNELKKPMPIIFVILDEFSIMSQVLSESDSYKRKLQNILAKGRSSGIKFIFSSQSFETGIQGLTATAKEQIQSRIAMKNNMSEIETTLELPSFMKTEENKYWMATLPAHMALRKFMYKTDENDETTLMLERTSVMYFPGEDPYAPQRKMIDTIKQNMTAIELEENKAYTYNNHAYADKKPVVVNGNTYYAFNKNEVFAQVKRYKNEQKGNLNGDEIFLYLGRPRLMTSMREVILTPEARQNILLVASSGERRCAASIITSCINSFALREEANKKGKKVRIWAYDRNVMYRNYKNVWGDLENIKIVSEMGGICDEIRQLKYRIDCNLVEDDELIVMIGLESLCIEFEYLKNVSDSYIDAETVSEEEIPQEIIEASKAGDSILGDLFEDDEIETIPKSPSKSKVISKDVDDERLYNANSDLKDVIKKGSRLGIHFMVCVNSYIDFKRTGLSLEEFLHRMAFRIPKDDAISIFPSGSSNSVLQMPEHVCMYTDMMSRFSFRPYIYKDINWDGWSVNNKGEAVND